MTIQPEFQAIILAAGKGSRMLEITSSKPKCLLPVGNRPLVWYPLFKLQESGFSDVIMVVLETEKLEIQTALDRSGLEIKIEYFSISAKEDFGTADSLRLLNDKLKSDVVVLSCDFITDFSLKTVLDLFRLHDASLVSLFFQPQQGEALQVPGPKTKYKPERDLVGVDCQTNRLVFLASASDFDGELALPRSLLRKHTHLRMHSNLIDSHVYIIKNWVIKYLSGQPSFSSLKGELLPYIVKKQLSKPRPDPKGKSIVSQSETEDIFNFAREDDVTLMIRQKSSYNDHSGDLEGTYHGDSIRCYSVIAPNGAFGTRVNTLSSYWSIHHQIIDKWAKITDLPLVLQHPNCENQSNQVDDKCVIWEGANLYQKTSFKNTLIGTNSHVHSFSRVFNSIVMNNVTIKEKVALENCIVSDGAVIESGCKIKGCLIGSQHYVRENSEHNLEVLTDSDRLMEF